MRERAGISDEERDDPCPDYYCSIIDLYNGDGKMKKPTSIKEGTDKLISSLCQKDGISREELYIRLEAYLQKVYSEPVPKGMDAALRKVFSNKPSVDGYLRWRFMDSSLHPEHWE